jgi:hypothetical protein
VYKSVGPELAHSTDLNRSRGDGEGKENLKLWFNGLILAILFVIGGVEVNPGHFL